MNPELEPKKVRRGVIGIVDAYSSANAFAAAFAEKGYDCIHIQTSEETPPIYKGSEKPELFVATIINHDFEDTLTALLELQLAAIVPGAESGVELADKLAMGLCLPSNDPSTVASRRDKFLMQETVRRAGLRSIPQVKVYSPAAALAWATSECGFPVVAKPNASAGSDSIYICNNDGELDAAVRALVGARNVLGNLNEYALVQRKIVGEQYVVNTVSSEGLHIVTDIWHSRRLHEAGRSIAYDYAELLPSDGALQRLLVQYSTQVLDALGICFGAAHIELFMTPEGPILIETGARMVGSGVPNIVTLCAGIGQLELTVLAYTDPSSFRARIGNYHLRKHARLVALISRQAGTLLENPDLTPFMRLPSFHHARVYLKKGDVIAPTTDLISSPGDIHLIHPDKEQIQRDLNEVRLIEQGMFKIAGTRD